MEDDLKDMPVIEGVRELNAAGATFEVSKRMQNLQMHTAYSSDGKTKTTTTGWIRTTITHSLLGVRAEKIYDPNTTGEKLKEKLHLIVGTKPAYMKLELRGKDNAKICDIGDDTKLSQLPLKGNVAHVHVVDVDPQKSMLEFTDVSRVKKYEISDEEYDKRKNSFRTWAKQNLKGHYEKKEQEKQNKIEQENKINAEEKKIAGDIKVGDRCQLGFHPNTHIYKHITHTHTTHTTHTHTHTHTHTNTHAYMNDT